MAYIGYRNQRQFVNQKVCKEEPKVCVSPSELCYREALESTLTHLRKAEECIEAALKVKDK